MKHGPERLSREMRVLLEPFFPGLNLSRVRVHSGIPWYVRGNPQGYADRHKVYIAPGCRTTSDQYASLLAHEIAHYRQYTQFGKWRFRALYLAAYFRNRMQGMSRDEAYWNIPFEIEAREIEAMVCLTLERRKRTMWE